MEEVLHVMSHDSILFFTEDGVARTLRAYQIPEASRTAVGAAITQVRPASSSHSQTASFVLDLMLAASACSASLTRPSLLSGPANRQIRCHHGAAGGEGVHRERLSAYADGRGHDQKDASTALREDAG